MLGNTLFLSVRDETLSIMLCMNYDILSPCLTQHLNVGTSFFQSKLSLYF